MSTVLTHQVTIWMAGDLATARRVCRKHCHGEGACFTVTPSKFIYTGGEEDGFAIGLVNYPGFTKETKWLVVEPPALLCPRCNGHGEIEVYPWIDQQCDSCGGTGRKS